MIFSYYNNSDSHDDDENGKTFQHEEDEVKDEDSVDEEKTYSREAG